MMLSFSLHYYFMLVSLGSERLTVNIYGTFVCKESLDFPYPVVIQLWVLQLQYSPSLNQPLNPSIHPPLCVKMKEVIGWVNS